MYIFILHFFLHFLFLKIKKSYGHNFVRKWYNYDPANAEALGQTIFGNQLKGVVGRKVLLSNEEQIKLIEKFKIANQKTKISMKAWVAQQPGLTRKTFQRYVDNQASAGTIILKKRKYARVPKILSDPEMKFRLEYAKANEGRIWRLQAYGDEGILFFIIIF